MGVEEGLFVLRANFELVTVSVDGEVGFFLKAVLGSRYTGINFSLQSGGVGSDDMVRVEGPFDFFLDFVAAREEAAFEKFLSV